MWNKGYILAVGWVEWYEKAKPLPWDEGNRAKKLEIYRIQEEKFSFEIINNKTFQCNYATIQLFSYVNSSRLNRWLKQNIEKLFWMRKIMTPIKSDGHWMQRESGQY